MAFQLLLNLFLAFVWMLIKSKYDFGAFFAGYFFGLLTMYLFRRFFNTRLYLHRVYAVFYLLLLFIKELVLANFAVLKVVLQPKLDFKPGIFAYPTVLTKDWEITVLANLITLTPGTLVVDVSMDNKILYVHAVDVPNADEAIFAIRNTFEKAILEVSR